MLTERVQDGEMKSKKSGEAVRVGHRSWVWWIRDEIVRMRGPQLEHSRSGRGPFDAVSWVLAEFRSRSIDEKGKLPICT